MARMLGVRANRVIMLAFAVSGMLAAAIGLILVTQTGTVDIQMGANLMLVAFVATVIGGLGSLPGAVLAGYLIGAATVIMQVVLPPDARPFRDAFVYGAVIAMLIWRPNGLFSVQSGKAEGVSMANRPSILARTWSTPVILIAILAALALAALAVGLRPLQPDHHRNLHPRRAGRRALRLHRQFRRHQLRPYRLHLPRRLHDGLAHHAARHQEVEAQGPAGHHPQRQAALWLGHARRHHLRGDLLPMSSARC